MKVNSLLTEAAELEGHYEWEVAAGVYKRALQAMTADGTERAAISLRLALCHEGAAFQKDSESAFLWKIEEAIAVYLEIEHAASGYPPWERRAGAGRLRLECILAEDAETRRRLLDKALDLGRSAIADFGRQGPPSAWLEAGNFGLLLLLERFFLDEELAEVITEGLALAEKLLKPHIQKADINARALTHTYQCYLAFMGRDHFENYNRDPSLFDDIFQKASAMEQEIQDKRILAWFLEGTLYTKSMHKGLEVTFEEIAECIDTARATRDRQLIGRALYFAIYNARWLLVAERDQELAQKRFQDILNLFDEMEANLKHLRDPISQNTMASAYGDLVQSHYVLADFATEPAQRKKLSEGAVAAFHKYLPLARRIGGSVLGYLDYAGTEALRQLAHLEGDGNRKLEILAEAVTIAEEGNVIRARVSPFFTWNIGVGYISEGSLRYDMARLMREQAKRRELLVVAVSRFRAGFGKIHSYHFPLSSGQVLRLGDFYLRFVSALDNLYKETAEQGLLEEQIQALTLASDAYSSAQYPARVSEALWHRAGVHSRKGDHRVAAQDYRQAAERFRAATTAMPSLGGLYHDLEKYMQAWCDIEEARASHAEGLYREASESYRRASSTLKDTQRWSHLSEHYSACSLLEGAEALSHEENPALASQAFIEAAAGFAISKQAISAWRASGEGEEKEKDQWGIVAGTRERYCGSRAGLEEAKLLDRRGKHALSARRFAAASATLESLAEDEESSEGKQELLALALLGKAWGLMKEAEAKGIPGRYEESAQLFERVAEIAVDEKLITTCRGNAAFCRALESGSRLRRAHNVSLYRETKGHLETAADFYTEAAMERAANWTRATEFMFDGLAYFARAEGKLEARSKGRFYALAERSFEAASRLYGEAGYSGKQEEANRHLVHAREKSHVFASPAEALDPSVVLQIAQAQVAPSLTHDQSLGIERFEASNVQSNLIVDRPEIEVGETSQLKVELVNAGHAPAALVRVSELAPSKFGIDVVGEKYRVEDGTISLKGLRLDPFDAAEISLLLRSSRPGEFTIRPRIHYLDERAQYRQHQPQPVTITVRNPGAEAPASSAEALTGFEFETQRAEAAFGYLVDAFIEDYMGKRLYLEHAGWRALTQIAKAAHIPISSLYGRRGGYGVTIAELLTRGLIETRILTEQKGRGGEVIKVRIPYDKEPVKRFVDQLIKKPA